MNRRLALPLTLLLLLTFCAPGATPPAPTQTGAPLAERTPTPTRVPPSRTPSPTLPPRPTPTPSRIASISLIENLVEARMTHAAEFAPANTGQTLPVGGQARTGEDGRARLDLAPDGTIIRLAPNSFFAVAELEEKEDASPITLLELFFGQIYIILSGGELHVQTPSGVASVRGSMMGVFYDPHTKTMTVTCLEGHCSLRNDKGLLELIAGQAADIRDGILSREPRALTDRELSDWLGNTPELRDHPSVLEGLPDRIDSLPKRPGRWR